jgi:hypothetical protein
MKINKLILCSISAMVLIKVFWPEQPSTKQSTQKIPVKDVIVNHSIEAPSLAAKDAQPFQLVKAVNQDSWISEGARLQMVDVSQAYEENIRYPKYSKPLHKNDWNLLNPRAFVPSKMALDFNQGLSAAIVLSEYIVSRDDDLTVKVQVSGEALSSVTPEVISVYLSDKGKHTKTLALTSVVSSEGMLTYTGIMDKTLFSDIENSEVMIIAELDFNNDEQAKVSAVFKLMGTEATLTSISDSFVEGAHLIIPTSFDVSTPGYYRIEANLFDKASQTPISHLNSAFLLTKRENTGLLKIHASTLRSKGFVGPYILTDFNITRRPAKPGDKTGYGRSEEDSFAVQGFDFSLYSQEEYVDPKNQQRLEFLQKMAGIK